ERKQKNYEYCSIKKSFTSFYRSKLKENLPDTEVN
ncbi:unnamed protein product, partial [marine sediment metagenome]